MSASSEQHPDKHHSDKQEHKRYRYLVFIGRFQPFHCGHKAVIDEALKRSDEVIMLIGSANLPRSLRNPFSVDERAAMIKDAYSDEEAARIHCVGLDDALYNDTRWLQYVQAGVKSVTGDLQTDIGLIGHSKDSSSYYLSLFPNWDSVSVPNYHNLSATPIRDSYLMGATPTPERTPESTRNVLDQFKKQMTTSSCMKRQILLINTKDSGNLRLTPYFYDG
ncbi:nicotinate-nicotinamide nucleotide adenylyltransferase [Psychrobacter alimentarius]